MAPRGTGPAASSGGGGVIGTVARARAGREEVPNAAGKTLGVISLPGRLLSTPPCVCVSVWLPHSPTPTSHPSCVCALCPQPAPQRWWLMLLPRTSKFTGSAASVLCLWPLGGLPPPACPVITDGGGDLFQMPQARALRLTTLVPITRREVLRAGPHLFLKSRHWVQPLRKTGWGFLKN